ncbi:hypothetical protein [Stappia sp. TSB10GB4]|uniref:hypothetical protein n=1 Tax=Stappia sp. TSB10GB4 TaxID=2003584 RepID=UPI0016492681|nr:hypothetical protein [Stappia sp. TSB10GB4]
MANASRKHMGVGAQGKGSGSGARTLTDKDRLGDNMVLSNRDKSRHARTRGLDSKQVQNDQRHDHKANRIGGEP